jgi:hypothetical protein
VIYNCDFINILLICCRRGSCLGTGHVTLAPSVSGTGEFLAHNPDSPSSTDSRLRVLYVDADYEAALIYSCTRAAADGGCSRGHEVITAVSRTREGLSEKAVEDMLALLEGHCLSKDDFHPVPHSRMYCFVQTP